MILGDSCDAFLEGHCFAPVPSSKKFQMFNYKNSSIIAQWHYRSAATYAEGQHFLPLCAYGEKLQVTVHSWTRLQVLPLVDGATAEPYGVKQSCRCVWCCLYVLNPLVTVRNYKKCFQGSLHVISSWVHIRDSNSWTRFTRLLILQPWS